MMRGPPHLSQEYDLIVIGSGPAGQKAAITAAKKRCRVALVERQEVIGGSCLHTGTIPSKTLREAVLYFTGHGLHNIYGAAYRPKSRITLNDLTLRVEHVIRHELDVIAGQMQRNGIDMYYGTARFTSPHTLVVEGTNTVTTLHGAKYVIAVGSEPARPAHIPFTPRRIVDSDDILDLWELPRTLVVVGAGIIGCEYASIFATLGVEVTLVDRRTALMDFIDREIVDTLIYHMRRANMTLRLGEGVEQVLIDDRERIVTALESGKRLISDTLLFAIGRQGATADLHLENTGLQPDARGRLQVNAHYQTPVEHIYAAGDIIGFPSLAATSMEQGRLAASHAVGIQSASFSQLSPYGIYTIPAISMVGQTEESLTQARVPYEIGLARYAELARGQILGDDSGLLKLLFHRDSHKLLGVHIIGSYATEIIHIGQAVMAHEGCLDYFVDTVFNYPTLAEAYKVAAFDGLNKL